MSAPVEFFTLRLLPGEIYHLDTIRDLQITNVSYSEPENLKGKKRSVLRVHYAGNPIDLEDDEDVEIEDDDEDEREDDEDEEDDDEDEDDDDEEEEDDDDEDDIVDMEPRVPIFTDDDSYVVCSLIPEKVEQVTLNLQISEEEEVGLSVSGDEPVDIIGNYLLPTSLNDLDPELLGELEDEDDEEAPRDRKLIEGPRDDDDEEDDDEEDDDEEDDDEEDDDEEDDDEEEDEDEDDEDEDGDIVIEDDDEDDDDEDDDEVLVEEDDDNDDDEEDIVIVPSKKRSVSDLDEDEPKLSRSQRKRLNKKLKAEASGQKQDKTKLPSGLIVEDKKAGSGPAAKPGNRVSMRYVGKLQNGSTFDSNTKGRPFSFRLGKGEVIKGWDEGVKGMQVGGERRLTCPPHLAYGKAKLPGLPPNSTLIFDVKLLEIK
ncbi:peptidyl-prolyl cis-trans isomerase [Malassezia restricta]|uniref:peptidyl-prolyl cis-trans isomerase n=1 Tax=Malassezia restricta TaxID=76775 RepID=UPI000DD185E4|nr:peptidyl-prolyl cis-trans isomerase [Malassezia restricta]AXA52200.1 peptidyl-prolyl cis-trans isomerase [Malassezia restricta]